MVEIRVPALRERGNDVLVLARHFLAAAAAHHQRTLHGLTDAAQRALARFAWPGNVRELQHVIERAVILGGPRAANDWLDEADLFATAEPATEQGIDTLASVERAAVERALADHEWNVSRAAQALGVTRQALYRRMERFGLTK